MQVTDVAIFDLIKINAEDDFGSTTELIILKLTQREFMLNLI